MDKKTIDDKIWSNFMSNKTTDKNREKFPIEKIKVDNNIPNFFLMIGKLDALLSNKMVDCTMLSLKKESIDRLQIAVSNIISEVYDNGI